jgi:hypothetical protein
MKLTKGTVEHIRVLAILREKEGLSRDDSIELFDSIDCMDMEELSLFYALVHFGMKKNESDFDFLVSKAKKKGFSVVEELFDNKDLGSYLREGLTKIEASNIQPDWA